MLHGATARGLQVLVSGPLQASHLLLHSELKDDQPPSLGTGGASHVLCPHSLLGEPPSLGIGGASHALCPRSLLDQRGCSSTTWELSHVGPSAGKCSACQLLQVCS